MEPIEIDVRVRQADLGRNGSASVVGMARWLEDARLRLSLRRFERLVGRGGFPRFQILFVGQRVERLAHAGRAGAVVKVRTGIRRIGRSSFTYEQSAAIDGAAVTAGEATVVLRGAGGPLELPDELIDDLSELPSSDTPRGPATERVGPERRRREHYERFAPVRARIGDVDGNHHVNYLAQLTWYDDAIAASALDTADPAGHRTIPDLAPDAYAVHYLGEVTYPGDYELGSRVRDDGANTLSYELAIFRGADCLGVADATVGS
jgi:acyl-CoA thioester hydrolase